MGRSTKKRKRPRLSPVSLSTDLSGVVAGGLSQWLIDRLLSRREQMRGTRRCVLSPSPGARFICASPSSSGKTGRLHGWSNDSGSESSDNEIAVKNEQDTGSRRHGTNVLPAVTAYNSIRTTWNRVDSVKIKLRSLRRLISTVLTSIFTCTEIKLHVGKKKKYSVIFKRNAEKHPF